LVEQHDIQQKLQKLERQQRRQRQDIFKAETITQREKGFPLNVKSLKCARPDFYRVCDLLTTLASYVIFAETSPLPAPSVKDKIRYLSLMRVIILSIRKVLPVAWKC